MSRFIGKLVLGFVACGAPLLAGGDKEAAADVPRLVFATSVALTCQNPGSHQDVAKSPVIKNSTTATLKAGQTINWKSSDGDSGSIKLSADLPPGGSITGLGKPGNAYSCTSAFYTNPDLTVGYAKFTSSSEVEIQVKNLDPWVGAGSSVVKLEVVSCSGQVLKTIESSAMTLAKGESKTFKLSASSAPSSYLRVKADSKQQVLEKNETNNTMDGMNSCIK